MILPARIESNKFIVCDKTLVGLRALIWSLTNDPNDFPFSIRMKRKRMNTKLKSTLHGTGIILSTPST